MKANPKLSGPSKGQSYNSLIFGRLYFHLIGLGALIWFLVRVIPKPSRASYPCMRAAFPLASAFVLYLLGLATSAFAITKVKKHWKNARYRAVAIFLIVALVSGFFAIQTDRPYVYADSHYLDTPNQPMGVGQGIFPGRMVWSWNPDATNENCKNDRFGEAYYLPKNSNMDVIQAMVYQSVLSLTGQPSIREAWDALFVYFNEKKGKGDVGYQSGQNEYWDLWHGEIPNVIYICHTGGQGRIQSQPGGTPLIFYSDRSTVLRSGNWNDASWGTPIYEDKFYTVIEQAVYIIMEGVDDHLHQAADSTNWPTGIQYDPEVDIHAKMQQAAQQRDVEALYEHVLEMDNGVIIEDGRIRWTRQEALSSTKQGLQGLRDLSYVYTQKHITVVSPTVALWVREGTSSATLQDGRQISVPFAEAIVFVQKEG